MLLFPRTTDELLIRFISRFESNAQDIDVVIRKVVNHVHFHIIPKPSDSDEEGLVIGWPSKDLSKDELESLHKEVTGKL